MLVEVVHAAPKPGLARETPTWWQMVRYRAEHYPTFFPRMDAGEEGQEQPSSSEQPMVRFADIGCGFGGLLIK
jgi:hypothetical protein